MKRFILFAGTDYSYGGAEDIFGDYDTITETKRAMAAYKKSGWLKGEYGNIGFFDYFDWAQILDTKTGKVDEVEK